jgi:hypothetical protein
MNQGLLLFLEVSEMKRVNSTSLDIIVGGGVLLRKILKEPTRFSFLVIPKMSQLAILIKIMDFLYDV